MITVQISYTVLKKGLLAVDQQTFLIILAQLFNCHLF